MLAQAFARAGEVLFGPQWQQPLARALDLNGRTVQRIAAAARDGQDYRIAAGVITQLLILLDQREAEVYEAARSLAKAAGRD